MFKERRVKVSGTGGRRVDIRPAVDDFATCPPASQEEYIRWRWREAMKIKDAAETKSKELVEARNQVVALQNTLPLDTRLRYVTLNTFSWNQQRAVDDALYFIDVVENLCDQDAVDVKFGKLFENFNTNFTGMQTIASRTFLLIAITNELGKALDRDIHETSYFFQTLGFIFALSAFALCHIAKIYFFRVATERNKLEAFLEFVPGHIRRWVINPEVVRSFIGTGIFLWLIGLAIGWSASYDNFPPAPAPPSPPCGIASSDQEFYGSDGPPSSDQEFYGSDGPPQGSDGPPPSAPPSAPCGVPDHYDDFANNDRRWLYGAILQAAMGVHLLWVTYCFIMVVVPNFVTRCRNALNRFLKMCKLPTLPVPADDAPSVDPPREQHLFFMTRTPEQKEDAPLQAADVEVVTVE